MKILVKSPTWKRVCHALQGRIFTFETVMQEWKALSPRNCPTRQQLATVLRHQPQIHIIESHKTVDREIDANGYVSNRRRQTYAVCDQWLADNPL